jgi:hypothetical protein
MVRQPTPRGLESPIRFAQRDVRHLIRTAVLALTVALVAAQLPLSFAHAADGPGTISGKVYLDPAGSAKPTDKGVPNIAVSVEGGGKTTTRKSGPDGGYSFELAPGRYTVRVAPPTEYRLTSEASLSVVVESRKATGGVSFGLAPKAAPTPTPTATPTAVPATPTSTGSGQSKPSADGPTPVAKSPALFVEPSPSASPVAALLPAPSSSTEAPTAESPTPTAAVAPDGAAQASAIPASGEEILAGRGVHWRVLESGPTLTPDSAPALGAAEGARSGPSRPVVTSLAGLRHIAASQLRSWSNESTLWLGVPFRTQLDGTEFSKVNCGPASLAMVLAGFGLEVDPAELRDYVNYLTGDYDAEDGTGLDVITRVGREAGLHTFGLYGGGGYRAWSVDEVREQVRAGHPVITLVKYRSLPGNGTSLSEFDHYIVITGLAGEDLIYNDPAFTSDYGFNLLISAGDLERAWSYSSVPHHAVAMGLGDSLNPLPNAPRGVSAASLAGAPELRETVQPRLGMKPGPATQWLRERRLEESGTGYRAAPSPAAMDHPATLASFSSTAEEWTPTTTDESSDETLALAPPNAVDPPHFEIVAAEASPPTEMEEPGTIGLSLATASSLGALGLLLFATLARHAPNIRLRRLRRRIWRRGASTTT